MARKNWHMLAYTSTPSTEVPMLWMTEEGEQAFTTTRQLMKYLRTTFLDREFKVISDSNFGYPCIEVKYRYLDW